MILQHRIWSTLLSKAKLNSSGWMKVRSRQKGNMYVLNGGDLRKSLISQFHDTFWMGNPREECAFCYSQLRDDIELVWKLVSFINRIRNIIKNLPVLLSILIRPFKSVFINYIIGLPKVGDISTILVVIDLLSKYATFIATPKYLYVEKTFHSFSNILSNIGVWVKIYSVIENLSSPKHFGSSYSNFLV